MSVPLYTLDPAVEEHLRLETFEEKFDVKDFVTSISEKLIAQSKADAGPFDPKPFIRTFELAVDRLIAVRKDLQKQSETAETSVRSAERDYTKRMGEINGGFDSVTKSFSSMESKINEVGRTAIRVGEQLESVHVSRQRAQAAYDLVDYYNQFSRGDTSKLDALRKEGGREGRAQTAIILRRLTIVAKEVDLPGAEKTLEAIDKYCEKFEKDMLRLFDKCYRKSDPKMMAHCAQTLLDFNGGASCVRIYVNQHDFFISKNRVVDSNTVESNQLWETLPDPDVSPPKTEPGLSALFEDIRSTMKMESQIVQVVFPNPPAVMQVFLQRVFGQPIQQYIEQLLNKAALLSNLAFLRMLHLAHVQTSALVEYLKTFELTAISRPSSSVSDRLSMMSQAQGGGSGNVAVGNILDSAMEELFSREISQYLERESKSLGELYSAFLSRFTKYHEVASKTKATGLFDRVVNQLGANTTSSGISSGSGSSTTAKATAAFMKFSGMSSSSAAQTQAQQGADGKPAEDPIREADGELSIEVAEKMLKWHAEAVGRCVEFGANSEVPKQAFALLRVLAEALGRSYVEAALDTTLARLDARDTKLEPSLAPLMTLRSVDLICTLWQQYTNIALLPLASSSVTVRREMVIYNNQTIGRIESSVNNVTVKVVDAVIAWLTAQLAKQKKNDFKPKNDDLSFARVNTEPCQACCEMLEKVRDASTENLTGKNREVFLTEIGVAFHGLLLDHLRKFPVSASGGLMLAKDLKSYQDTVSSFGLPALQERFEFIRQLGNVFLVRPEILKGYITEGYLGRIDAQLLRPYLAQRVDWGTFERGFDIGDEPLSAGPTSASADQGEAAAKSMRERFGVGRLASMMRELEGLKLGFDDLPNVSAYRPTGFTMPSVSLAGLGLQAPSNHLAPPAP
ncbi:exocyst complex component Sec10 [Auricularia subglabra TFB-10046 SS5]|nr:exocyst complex component Sec10 [Auricularia subglabra TFB-10046 SS5]